MTEATESATAGSSLAPFSMVATTDLYTDFGNRSRISARVKTFDPNIEPGSSVGSKLIAGGTYASTLLIACSRTAFPLIEFLSPRAPATLSQADRPTLGTLSSGNVTCASPPECGYTGAGEHPLRRRSPRPAGTCVVQIIERRFPACPEIGCRFGWSSFRGIEPTSGRDRVATLPFLPIQMELICRMVFR